MKKILLISSLIFAFVLPASAKTDTEASIENFAKPKRASIVKKLVYKIKDAHANSKFKRTIVTYDKAQDNVIEQAETLEEIEQTAILEEVEQAEILESTDSNIVDNAETEATTVVELPPQFTAIYETEYSPYPYVIFYHPSNVDAKGMYPYITNVADKRGIPKNPGYTPVRNKNWEHWSLN